MVFVIGICTWRKFVNVSQFTVAGSQKAGTVYTLKKSSLICLFDLLTTFDVFFFLARPNDFHDFPEYFVLEVMH